MYRYLLCLCPALAMAEVPQGAANAEFEPAFAEQTRAPALDTTDVEVSIYARGFDTPWGIEPLPTGEFLVTERPGRLRIVHRDGSVSEPVEGLPKIAVQGQGGLLDIAVSPTFGADRVVYFTYSKPVGTRSVTAAARAVLTPQGELTDVDDIFVQTPPVASGRHFGSRVIPAPDGTIWVTTGDRGAGDRGELVQRMDNTHGKIVRIAPDGSAPADNPYAGRRGEELIWSLGHRNVQGAALRDGELWAVEHGPRGGDELNRIIPGANYGWPLVSYGVNYNKRPVGTGAATAEGLEAPVYYWDPVIAPGGMIFYDGPHMDWAGDALIASLNPGGLVRLQIRNDLVHGEERLLTEHGRIRDVTLGTDGAVYVLVDSPDGIVLRLTPKGS